MRTFAQKQGQSSKALSTGFVRPRQSTSAPTQNQHDLLELQRVVGNQVVQRMLKYPAGEPVAKTTSTRNQRFGHDFSRIPIHPPVAGVIQTKLKVNEPGDEYEREADRVSEQVMQAASTPQVSGRTAVLQRECACGGTCDDCKKRSHDEERAKVQMKAAGPVNAGGLEAPPIVHDVLRSPCQLLDASTRAFMEPRFGRDFGRVRIHADTRAAESARSVNARAYTVGQHVVFGRDQYAPHTANGRHLLAHELTHTLQQGSAPRLRRAPPDPPPPPPPARPDLEARLQIIEETGPAAQTRLDQIIRTGGPIPTTTKVIGAAIIDVEGYQGPKEMRAINGADTDALGNGAPVYHAISPTNRTLTATQGPLTEKGGRRPSILGPRNESIYPHINDAEIKLFEDIIARLPKGAKGIIHFSTVRVRQVDGKTVIEPYPACSGCIRASFETAGRLPEVDLVSHAAVHPTGTADVGTHPDPGEHDKPAPAGGGRTKPLTGTGADQGNEHEGGGSTPTPKTTGPVLQTGRSAQVAIHIGTGIASVGLAWLAGYLKARVDQKIAQRQIDAFLEVAKKRINANPDEALKKMMLNPYRTVYAWVHLDSAVITTFGVDNTSPEPSTSDSSPIFDLGPIEYMSAPVDPSLIDSFPRISGGGRHITMVRTIVIDIPLTTPPLEVLISFAKDRHLPLDDLNAYVSGRYQAALSSFQTVLEAHQKILGAFQTTNDVYQKLQAEFQIAKKRHDVELQKLLAEKLLSVAGSLTSITDRLKPVGEMIQKSDQNLKYWAHMLDLVKPTMPRP